MAKQKTASTFENILSQVKPSALKEPASPAAVQPRLSKTKKASASLPQGKRGGKSSDPAYTQATLYIRKDTHHKVKLKILSMQQDKDMSDLAEELFSQWLKGEV